MRKAVKYFLHVNSLGWRYTGIYKHERRYLSDRQRRVAFLSRQFQGLFRGAWRFKLLWCLQFIFSKWIFELSHANSSKVLIVVVQFSSVAQSCPTPCNPMNRRTPGLPVHHQLPEFTQTYAHRVGDAIQPSHPLSSPSPPAPNPSQHQGLFQWVNSTWGSQSIGVSASASVLPMNTQDLLQSNSHIHTWPLKKP